MSQGSRLEARLDMISCPSSAAPGPAEAPVTARRMWSCLPQQCGCSGGGWGARWLPARHLCQEFPGPDWVLRRREKLFTRDTTRNCRVKLTSCLGEKQDPARCPGNPEPRGGAPPRGREGTAPAPKPRDHARPTGARTRSSAGPGPC